MNRRNLDASLRQQGLESARSTVATSNAIVGDSSSDHAMKFGRDFPATDRPAAEETKKEKGAAWSLARFSYALRACS
jgi:hypothetical protein